MKIVIVSTAYPLRGGIAHYIALLSKYLSNRHSVEIITFKRQYPAFLFPGKTQQEHGDKGETVVQSRQLIDSINPLTWIRVAFEIRKINPDLLIFKYWLPFFGPCFGTISLLSRFRSKTKTLFICDNIIPHEKRIGDVLFTKFAFSFVDFFIVQSKVVEKDLLGMFPNVNYSFTPHPVYEIFGEPISKEFARNLLRLAQGKYILFFGYIRKYKGLSILIDAMKYLSDLKDLKLLVVGEFYEDEEKYRTQVEEEKLGERVIFYSDYVPNEEVVKFFCASDVVVLPYLSATQSGIVQIAYQFGKPVISTNVGGLAEVLIDGKTGFIVPPNNSVALADAIRNFYDEGKGDDFSRNALEEKKKYTWMALVEAIERFIEK